MAARPLLVLLLALAASQAALGAEDVVTITGGLKELEALVKKHPFVATEARQGWRRWRRWLADRRAAAAAAAAGGLARPLHFLLHRSPPTASAVLRALVRALQAAGAGVGQGRHHAQGQRPAHHSGQGARGGRSGARP